MCSSAGARARSDLAILRSLGANRVAHSEAHLLDHLLGTYQILREWHAPRAVCRAGLFHSLYGTSTFESALVSTNDRATVIALLGRTTERLVFLFCAKPPNLFETCSSDHDGVFRFRSRFDGSVLVVRPSVMDQLMLIYHANGLEQLPRLDQSYRRKLSVIVSRFKSLRSPDREPSRATGPRGVSSGGKRV